MFHKSDKPFHYLFPPTGFTLIELLIVIVIIGILASVVVLTVNPSLMYQRSRDSVRLEDMNNLTKALALFLQKNEAFPGPGTWSYGEWENVGNPICPTNDCGGWDTSAGDCDSDGKPFIEPLQDQGFFGKVPVDPQNTINTSCGGYHYRYYRYGAGSYGCDASKGAYYVLGVRDMETAGNPHPQSPGWSCPSRNWQGEFDWVTGKFE